MNELSGAPEAVYGFPLSSGQERLWFLHQLEPELPVYNITSALRLRGALDVPALADSLAEIVGRHEAFRTNFLEVEGTPVQVVAPEGDFTLITIDLSATPAATREAEALRSAREFGTRPFDLGRDPLFRAALLRLEEDEHLLVLAVHHIVSDGWTLGVVRRELSALYAARVSGAPSPLTDPPLQYVEYTAWQGERLESGALDGELAYWRERLAGMPPVLPLPSDRPRPAAQ
ncbi:MAG TPA: condensation domain-containing protein, partial [Longimicrobium sp.]|nr:condensation domain-containing protein [Longimicrobium sp.]